MRSLQLIAFLGLTGLLFVPARAGESNFWPLAVRQTSPDGSATSEVTVSQGGPLGFGWWTTGGRSAGGVRPFYIFRRDPVDHVVEQDVLYPLLMRREYGPDVQWSLMELVNFVGPKDRAAPGERQFDVWPFYFSRHTGDPATTYHALFPIHGTIVNRLGYDRLSWTLFPLYGRFEQHGVTTTTTPWPFIKVVEGAGTHGFALWPLFGWREKTGDFSERFWLWPFFYRNRAHLGAPEPDEQLGVLPFYSRERTPDSRSETWLWPFFGYTHRRAPDRYDEQRWFWPLLVQGRGDQHMVDRWAPLYTHSLHKGDDKRWLLWPLFRRERWTDAGLTQTKTQVVYFFYWSLRQRSATHPALAPAAKTHLWPLFSYWDNGAGHHQFQFLSPLEVFFQDNEQVRLAYTPFFALYRFDRRAPDDVRWSLLWNAVTWRHQQSSREFHVGPLLGVVNRAGDRRIALGGGLIGLRRQGAAGWRLFLFDFSPKPVNLAPRAGSP